MYTFKVVLTDSCALNATLHTIRGSTRAHETYKTLNCCVCVCVLTRKKLRNKKFAVRELETTRQAGTKRDGENGARTRRTKREGGDSTTEGRAAKLKQNRTNSPKTGRPPRGRPSAPAPLLWYGQITDRREGEVAF